MYDAGRRIGGFDATTAEGELATLRNRVAALEDELKRVRAVNASADSRMQIEKTAQTQLAKQLKAVEAENARLREDVSFFEGLAARGITEDKLVVSRFKVEHDAMPGEFRYRVLVTQGGKEREFNGRLQFVVNMQLGGKDVAVVIPEEKSEEAAYRLNFKRFFRAEGSFRVDPKATVRSVQVRVIESGGTQPRATLNYTLS
jgi:multidrug efflux pump subunit AcrA (membrane-fusion protein)